MVDVKKHVVASKAKALPMLSGGETKDDRGHGEHFAGNGGAGRHDVVKRCARGLGIVVKGHAGPLGDARNSRSLIDSTRESEVDQSDRAVAKHEDVARVHIPVKYAEGVKAAVGGADWSSEIERGDSPAPRRLIAILQHRRSGIDAPQQLD